RRSYQQTSQNDFIHARQRVEVAGYYMLIDLVNGGIHGPQFDDLGPGGRDETTVRCAAGGGELGLDTRHLANGIRRRFDQCALRGEEWGATQRPLDRIIEAVLLQQGLGALTQAIGSGFGGKAEIEQYFEFVGNHVGGAGAGLDVGTLKRGCGEEGTSLLPA